VSKLAKNSMTYFMDGPFPSPSSSQAHSSQVKFRLLHDTLERTGQASDDTAATEAYYIKGH